VSRSTNHQAFSSSWLKLLTNQGYCYLVKCTFGKLLFFLHVKVAIWEIVTWENVHLESYRFSFIGKLLLGNLHIGEVATWENTLKKLPLGKRPLEKYLTAFIII